MDVKTHAGRVILASDACHYRSELELEHPFGLYTDLLAMLKAYRLMRRLGSQPNVQIVTGHDPAEMERFERVTDSCIDLARPV